MHKGREKRGKSINKVLKRSVLSNLRLGHRHCAGLETKQCVWYFLTEDALHTMFDCHSVFVGCRRKLGGDQLSAQESVPLI